MSHELSINAVQNEVKYCLTQVGPLKQGRIKGKTDGLAIYKSGSVKLLAQ